MSQRTEIRKMFGSFWNTAWKDEEFYNALVTSTEFLFNRLSGKVAGLPDFLSRFDIPTKAYKESDYVLVDELVLKRKPVVLGTFLMDQGRTLDELQLNPQVWAMPTPMDNISIITDSPVKPQLMWQRGSEFDIVDGELRIYADPFQEAFKQHIRTEDGDTIKMVDLWLLDDVQESNFLADYYGRIVGMITPSDNYYKKILNAVYDLLQEGATRNRVAAFIGSILDTDVSRLAGTVEDVWDEGTRTWVAIGDELHSCPGIGRATVVVGDTVQEGSLLFDVFSIYSGRESIDPGDFPVLVLGRAFVDTLSNEGLMFENAEVETDTYRFPIGGYQEDVDAFWDAAEAQAIARGVDLQAAIIGNQHKPWVINPFEFIRSNFLAASCIFVTADLSVVPDQNALKLLRYLDLTLPAGTTYFMTANGIAVEDTVPLCTNDELPGALANDAAELDIIAMTDYVKGSEKLY